MVLSKGETMPLRTSRFSPLTALLIAGLLTLGACGHDDHAHDNHDNHDSLSAEEEACLHANDVPQTVQAAATAVAAAADINQPHTHYRIVLLESTETPGEYMGYVTFTPDKDGDFAIFTSVAIPVAIVDADGTAVSVTTSAVDECVEITQKHAADFHDERHIIAFGPTSEPELSVIVESLGSHGHDH